MVRFCFGLWCTLSAVTAFAGDVPSAWRETLGRAEELRLQRRFPEAEKILVDALSRARGDAESDAAAGVALNNLGSVYQAEGRYLESESAYRRSLAMLERTLGPDHIYLARTVLLNFSELYLETGRGDKAERLLERALAILSRAEPDPEKLASAKEDLASVYVYRGQLEDARPLLEDALALYLKAFGPDHPHTATALNNLAALTSMSGKQEEADRYARRAVAILEPRAAYYPVEYARVMANLGRISANAEEADACFRRAIAAAEPALGAGHPLLAPILRSYADMLRRTNRKREAKAVWARAERIRTQSVRDNALGMTVDARALVAR